MTDGDVGPSVNASPFEAMTIGGLTIARLSRAEMSSLMVKDVGRARHGDLRFPRLITSANGSVVAQYHRDMAFRDAVDQMDLIDADGMPLVFASRILCKRPLVERTATTDFLLDAAKMAEAQGIRFFFVGAKPGVAARAADHLRFRFPNLQIAGVRHGYFRDEDVPALCEQIRQSKADILWLGLGNGRQERIAVQCREKLAGVAWVRTCGGLFDHYGGGVSRAPTWMQAFGLEWLYRAAREPVRLGLRYLITNPIAVYHLATKTHD